MSFTFSKKQPTQTEKLLYTRHIRKTIRVQYIYKVKGFRNNFPFSQQEKHYIIIYIFITDLQL